MLESFKLHAICMMDSPCFEQAVDNITGDGSKADKSAMTRASTSTAQHSTDYTAMISISISWRPQLSL